MKDDRDIKNIDDEMRIVERQQSQQVVTRQQSQQVVTRQQSQQVVKNQQFTPGRRPGPGQRPPGMPGGQPPSAPPRFTPKLPREEEQQLFSEPSRVGGPFGGRIIDFRRRPRNFRNCMNRFTYIWLVNGNNFWFYPIDQGRNTIEGFRWRRNRWEFDRININRILFHSCF